MHKEERHGKYHEKTSVYHSEDKKGCKNSEEKVGRAKDDEPRKTATKEKTKKERWDE